MVTKKFWMRSEPEYQMVVNVRTKRQTPAQDYHISRNQLKLHSLL